MKKVRQEFADTMLEIGQVDPNLVVLIGDIGHFALQPFAAACPDRFYNIGICEPTIVNMAAGLSKVGFYPVVHTIAPFIVERSFEQIKLDFGYQELGVNLVTVGSAFDYGALGCTHHCYDDFALLKNIPGSQILYPSTCQEFNTLFKQTYNNQQITYFRVPEAQHTAEIDKNDIVVGKGILINEGDDVTIIAVGSQLQTALEALPLLSHNGIKPDLIYLHTVKPLDKELIKQSAIKTKLCVTIEEHAKYGGIADDVLRITNDINHVRCHSLSLGDTFIHKYGNYQQHCENRGLTAVNLAENIKSLIQAKMTEEPVINTLNIIH